MVSNLPIGLATMSEHARNRKLEADYDFLSL